MPQQSASNSLGLSALNQSSSQDEVSCVLSSLTKQQSQQVVSMSQTMNHLSQFSQSQIGMGSQQVHVSGIAGLGNQQVIYSFEWVSRESKLLN